MSPGCVARRERLQTDGLRHPLEAGHSLGVGNDDHLLHVRKLLHDLRYAIQGVVPPPVVEITVGSEQHLGRDLTEAADYATHAEVR